MSLEVTISNKIKAAFIGRLEVEMKTNRRIGLDAFWEFFSSFFLWVCFVIDWFYVIECQLLGCVFAPE